MLSFVADGEERARDACEPRVREEVAQEFVARLATASGWRRWLIEREMEREVERRVRQIAPPDGLY